MTTTASPCTSPQGTSLQGTSPQGRDSNKRTAEERFRLLFEEAPVGQGELTLDGHVIAANRALCTLLGYEAAQLVGMHFLDFMRPDEHVAGVANFDALLQGRVAQIEEARTYETREGREVDVIVRAGLLHSTTGDPERIAASVQDVTVLRNMERKLAASEARFRAAFELGPTPMMLVGPGGRLLQANEALGAFLGRPTTTLVDAPLDLLVHPGDVEALRNAFCCACDDEALRVRAEALMQTYDLRFVRRNGSVVWGALRVAVIATSAGVPALLGQIEDLTERKAVERALRHDALHDPLTGLPNRRLLLEHLSGALARAHRARSSVAVLFCDLDGFKAVNDARGHAAGDAVLVEVAQRLRHCLRSGDVAARVGGDEFVTLCENTGPEAAQRLARRLTGVIAAPMTVGQETTCVGASLGWATSEGAGEPEGLLDCADRAMYAVKRGES